jgi:putative transposase
MQVSHKIELKPNNKQKTYFQQACGVMRFCWNWGLAEWEKQYQQHLESPALPKPNGLQLKKQLNAIKATEFPWMYDVTKYASQQPFIYLQRGFDAFFKGNSKRPRFKKKGRSIDSFYVGGDQIKVIGQKIKIPNLGMVRLREPLRFGGHIQGVTIRRQANKWFASLSIDAAVSPLPCKSQARVGVDLGINHLATLSTGEVFENTRPLQQKLRRLKRHQRQLMKRKQKGSKKSAKLKLTIAKLHQQVGNQRQDSLHKLSTKLIDEFGTIVIEDLAVSNMLANRRLARSIADVGFYEFRRQLSYKADWHANQLIIANRWFPSSKQCSGCHQKNVALTLSDRVFVCSDCGLTLDRDLNAAINLEKYTDSSSGIHALGQDGNAVVYQNHCNQLG